MEASIFALASRVRFDAVLVGRGRRNGNQVIIDEIIWLQGLPESFVSEYTAVAPHDRVAQLFLDFPWEPQTVSTSDYLDDAQGGRRTATQRSNMVVGDYLKRFGIRHFMLAGVESSYGLAWVTFFRIGYDIPFSDQDAERAKFELPAVLYRWQEEHLERPAKSKRSCLSPLTRREMEVCVRNVRGEAPKAIARDLCLSVHYVRELIQRSRVKLGVSGRKLTMNDLMLL